MKTLSYAVGDFWLVMQEIASSSTKVVDVNTSHILILDCSGSMYHELPKIREQLKKKLPKLLRESDVLSIIWFSGRNEFGTLLEAEPVATLKDLATVNSAIDRWLKPIGLTGFLQPIQEMSTLISRIGKTHPGYATSLFFMSDGHDNCSNRADILSTIEKAAGSLAAATFVEYGYYADRPLLTAMAEKAGGQLIFAEHFDKYEPVLEASLGKKLSGAPKVEVKVSVDVVEGFVYSLSDGDLITYAVSGGKVVIPEDLSEIWYLTTSGKNSEDLSELIRESVNAA